MQRSLTLLGLPCVLRASFAYGSKTRMRRAYRHHEAPNERSGHGVSKQSSDGGEHHFPDRRSQVHDHRNACEHHRRDGIRKDEVEARVRTCRLGSLNSCMLPRRPLRQRLRRGLMSPPHQWGVHEPTNRPWHRASIARSQRSERLNEAASARRVDHYAQGDPALRVGRLRVLNTVASDARPYRGPLVNDVSSADAPSPANHPLTKSRSARPRSHDNRRRLAIVPTSLREAQQECRDRSRLVSAPP
jgi:hypothetical protein